ncbi:chemotaxis protein CheA [Chitinimonas taiwanensis]|uniref:Chemotaxis protein CheA n=1 Tax=Chitinimonas taiwanensis DSM 18899 TaxID=1121279 RepID=A0A1K2HCA4_9NEIS|nr:chemotaxis protein CheA [Chitinimonas taiwanensis]SFZ74382.1 two-component system, chemotaxis family, sensor kinase CheA [Chitinimonas taiwanensis DSM 18899]
MNLEAAKQVFYEESEELLAAMEAALLAVETSSGTQRAEHLNAMFRAAHTIKGSAGLFDLGEMVAFTHRCESLLDRLRENELALTADLIELLFACRDHMSAMLAAVHDKRAMPYSAALEAQLDAYLNQPADSSALPPARRPEAQVERQGSGEHGVASDYWHISLRFGPDVLRNGMDPISFVRYLGSLGRIVYITTLYDALPEPDQMDAESCYLGLEIQFAAAAHVDKLAIENVFDFIRDDSNVRILPPHAHIADYVRLIKEMPEGASRLGEILVRGGALTPLELDEVLGIQREQAEAGEHRQLGELLVEERLAPPQAVEAALDKQREQVAHKTREHRAVRVDAARLDGLIDLVGELVIAGAASQLFAKQIGNATLLESLSSLSELVERIRDEALSLRMVPVGDIFSRFPRVVRDAARELGKDIQLELAGEDTELDKSMVDKLGDPLLHLVRNAIDHGIESSELRRQRGKADYGTVWLNAYHESGSVVIEVGDDGGGMQRERIRVRAIERGLLGADEVIGDQALLQMVFEPGFSTADNVTSLSGRGVGMDVVKRNIEAMKGNIEIESMPGEGTVVRLRMPLTLAIIDGFQVALGKSTFVIPLDMVLECLDLPADTVAANRHYLNLRGEVLPFLNLRQLFEVGGIAPQRQAVVVVQYGSHRAGLVVDRLEGELQAVIKPLGQLFRGVKGLAGSTILGSGAVALILDVPDLIQRAAIDEQRRLAVSSQQEAKRLSLREENTR